MGAWRLRKGTEEKEKREEQSACRYSTRAKTGGVAHRHQQLPQYMAIRDALTLILVNGMPKLKPAIVSFKSEIWFSPLTIDLAAKDSLPHHRPIRASSQ